MELDNRIMSSYSSNHHTTLIYDFLYQRNIHFGIFMLNTNILLIPFKYFLVLLVPNFAEFLYVHFFGFSFHYNSFFCSTLLFHFLIKLIPLSILLEYFIFVPAFSPPHFRFNIWKNLLFSWAQNWNYSSWFFASISFNKRSLKILLIECIPLNSFILFINFRYINEYDINGSYPILFIKEGSQNLNRLFWNQITILFKR